MSESPRVVREGGRPRVVVADASNLIYSDNYRDGWVKGFQAIGCSVSVVDISILARTPSFQRPSIYSSAGAGKVGKMLAQQVIALQPDLVWCHHGRAASRSEFASYLRRHGVLTAVYLCDEPYECGETARYSPAFDLVFTMDPCTIALHKAARSDRSGVWYLPPAADVTRFERRKYELRTGPRALFLGNASLTPRPEFLRPVEQHVAGTQVLYWQTVGKRDQKWVPIERHPELYANCLVGLDVHRSPWMNEECWKRRRLDWEQQRPAPGFAPPRTPPERWGTGFWNELNLPAAHVNPRFFEMAACGTCVVSDDGRPELARMFPAAPRAATPEEYLRLVMHYVENLDDAAEVGHECASTVWRRHTYAHRAAEILHRAGLSKFIEEETSSSLGEPQDWLTTQDFDSSGVSQSSARTGAYAPFVRPTGSSSSEQSSRAKQDGSLNLSHPWLS